MLVRHSDAKVGTCNLISLSERIYGDEEEEVYIDLSVRELVFSPI